MAAGGRYEFGHYRLDVRAHLLFRNGRRVVLTPKAVDLLAALVEAQGEPVGKQELLHRVWPDAVVEEGSLTSHISLLRRVLAEGAGGRQFIETLPKRGYRFVGPCAAMAQPAAATGAGRRMLVVLPFENLSGGRKHDYFSEGLTEEMISQLARLSPEQLGVIARTSAMQYKSTTKTAQQIGQELGVSHLLEGSVRRSGERVRITAQLIRVSDATHLWAEGYERSLHDILALQAEVARAIAREIQIKLTVGVQHRLDRVAAIDPEAHEAYLRGRHLWNRRTEEGLRNSIALYEEAIRRQPDYAMAYTGVADSYVMLACRGMVSAKETFRRARAAARKALEIDPDHFLPHLRMGLVRLQQEGYPEAIRELQTAARLANHSTETLAALGTGYAMAGMSGEAHRIVAQLQASQAEHYVLPYNIAKIYAAARDKDKSFEWLERAYQEGDPDLIELNSEPLFDRLRGEPKFSELMRRIGFRVPASRGYREVN